MRIAMPTDVFLWRQILKWVCVSEVSPETRGKHLYAIGWRSAVSKLRKVAPLKGRRCNGGLALAWITAQSGKQTLAPSAGRRCTRRMGLPSQWECVFVLPAGDCGLASLFTRDKTAASVLQLLRKQCQKTRAKFPLRSSPWKKTCRTNQPSLMKGRLGEHADQRARTRGQEARHGNRCCWADFPVGFPWTALAPGPAVNRGSWEAVWTVCNGIVVTDSRAAWVENPPLWMSPPEWSRGSGSGWGDSPYPRNPAGFSVRRWWKKPAVPTLVDLALSWGS